MLKLAKIIPIIVLLIISARLYSQTNVTATIDAIGRTATMSNGIVTLSINSGGQVSSLIFNGKELINVGYASKFTSVLSDLEVILSIKN